MEDGNLWEVKALHPDEEIYSGNSPVYFQH